MEREKSLEKMRCELEIYLIFLDKRENLEIHFLPFIK